MRVKNSGIAFAVMLFYAFAIAMMLPAAAADTTSHLVSESVYIQAPPTIVEPGVGRTAVPAGSGSGAAEPKNICLDFHAADIADVLKALSVQSGANIVTGTDVKGQVTVSLNKVSLHEALDMITKLSGFKYASVAPDTYIVGSGAGVNGVLDEGSTEKVTEAVTINYADVDQLGKLLTAQVPGLTYTPSGSKPDAPGPKVLVMTGSRSVIDSAKSVITQIEESMAREVENNVVDTYRLKYASAKDAATLLSQVLPGLAVSLGPTTNFNDRPPAGVTFVTGSGSSSQAGSGGTGEAKEEPTMIILSGTPEDVAKAKELLSSIDVRPKQVLIEAKVADITVGAIKRLGITWSWNSIGIVEDSDEETGGGTGKFTRLPFGVEGQLDAMLKDNTANLLANPTVAAIEGKPAVIFIGDEVKYIIRIEETLTGINFQTETANVGVTLRVIARPDDDGYITLALHPEVSTISDWLTIGTGTGGNSAKTAIALPQIARRFTDHVIRVKDGETIVIGGLIRDNEVNNMTKVPLLGDIPFFGGLFRHREKTKQHSDITIFLKATVMKD